MAAPAGNAAGDGSAEPQSGGAASAANATPTSGARQSGSDTNPGTPSTPPAFEVRLPDGSFVDDVHKTPYNQTGHLLAPVADLSHIAQAGREAGGDYRELLKNPDGGLTAQQYMAIVLGDHFRQGGIFDYQRAWDEGVKGGFRQLPQFRHVANFNIGLYAQQAGLPLDETLGIAGLYAWWKSKNYASGAPYGIDPEDTEFITKGFQAGASGVFDQRARRNGGSL